jgi:hypothetical protein
LAFLYLLIVAARSFLAGHPANLLARVGFVLSMALGAWYVRQHGRAWHNYRMGCNGENQVAEQLGTALDHGWTIYRNLQLPERRDDLDLLLFGLGGVWAVQVKTFAAPLVRCDAKHDPAAQVTRQATTLHDFQARIHYRTENMSDSDATADSGGGGQKATTIRRPSFNQWSSKWMPS